MYILSTILYWLVSRDVAYVWWFEKHQRTSPIKTEANKQNLNFLVLKTKIYLNLFISGLI